MLNLSPSQRRILDVLAHNHLIVDSETGSGKTTNFRNHKILLLTYIKYIMVHTYHFVLSSFHRLIMQNFVEMIMKLLKSFLLN